MAVAQLRTDTEGRRYYKRKLAAGKSPNEAMRCLIGGVSGARPGWRPGRGSRSCRGMASLPCLTKASFSSATADAPRPPRPALGTCPLEGRTMRNRRRGLDTDESTIDSIGEARDDLCGLGLGKPHP